MPSQPNAPIWSKFTREGNRARCHECGKTYSCQGKSGSSTTTNLHDHLKRFHIIMYHEVQQLSTEQQQMSSKSTISSAKDQLQQQNIVTAFGSNQLYPSTHPHSISLDTAIAEMLALDDLSFNFVEGLGFTRVMQLADKRYKVKSRQYYSDNVLPKIQTKVFTKIYKMLSMAIKISFTTDIWTAKNAKLSLMSLTAHIVTVDFDRIQVVLCASEITERHTGEHIDDIFRQMLNTWNISTDRVHLVLRDGGASMKKALQLTGVPHTDCGNHQLHLVVTSAVAAQRTVRDCFTRCRQTASHFNHSNVAQQELKTIQTDTLHETIPVVPAQDCVSRWNTGVAMLRRHKQLEAPLKLYTGKIQLPQTDFDLIPRLIDALEGFEQMTKELSRSDATLGDLLATSKSLLRSLEERSDAPDYGIQAFRKELFEDLRNRMGSLETNDEVSLAAALDPRYKLKLFSTASIAAIVRQRLVDVAEEYRSDHAAPTSQPQVKRARIEHSSSFQASLAAMLIDSDDEDALSGSVSESPAEREVASYIAMKRIPAHDDPFKWWKANRLQLPMLARAAQVFLSAPPTSTPSEQLFASAGVSFEPRRSRLSGPKAEMLLFLKYNLCMLKLKYDDDDDNTHYVT